MGLCTFFLKESQTRKFTFYSGQKIRSLNFSPLEKVENIVGKPGLFSQFRWKTQWKEWISPSEHTKKWIQPAVLALG